MTESIRNLFRVILVVWFVVVSAFVFVSGYQVLSGAQDEPASALPAPPAGPESDDLTRLAPTANATLLPDLVTAYQHRTKLFEHRAKAYEKQIAAYTKFLEERAKTGALTKAEAFRLVVKDTLLTVVTQFLTALFAYVFVNAGSQVLTNQQRVRNNKEPVSVQLF